jgi:deaminated glutathione amidase
MTLSVACVQMNSGGDIHANIAKIEAMVADAAKRGAQMVALPENCFVMEEPGQGAARVMHTLHDHPGLEVAQAVAKNNRVWLLVGSMAVKIDESGKTLNRSLLIGDSGQIVHAYDKIHLFDVELPGGEKYMESAKMLPGAHAVVADTPWAKLGMTVCYDVRFPHLYRTLAQAGAKILAVPAAFTYVTGEAHWHVLLRARAIENGCFVIAPAQVGTHPGNRRTYGHALIVDPWGKVLADAGSEEGVIIAKLDMQQVEQVRSRIPSLKHDRPFDLAKEG